MKKKISGSLFQKVFLATMLFLLSMGLFVYALLAWLMPRTYSNKLSKDLDEQAKGFIAELEQVAFKDCSALFSQFIQSDGIHSVELYTDSGEMLLFPLGQGTGEAYAAGQETAAENTISQNEAVFYEDTPEGNEILSASYYFSFSDSNKRYMLLVYGKAEQISKLRSSFLHVFPLLLCMAILAAFLFSWLYTYIITKPILRIIRISQKMSDLNLEWNLEATRSDELGLLEKSLNFLSHKLAATISDLQSANEKLSQDIEREKALEQARLDFFSAVSHELKTPITIIKGQLEGMLLGIGAYKNHNKYLARSLEIANTMESMVQEILTVTRLEVSSAKDMPPSAENYPPIECIQMIQDYLAENEDIIIKKDLRIHCHMPQKAYISGNKILMEKVFSNLIGNAIKYTPQGAEISITINTAQDGHKFSIENTGTHIPESCFPKLFDAFYRIDPSRSRETGGSGLGLFLVQKILQQHKSHCSVCNTDSGVCFSFVMALGDGKNA